ncbi:MAG: SDR family NAD(P)-dependent oxidoreductase [Candidatus Hadarchaeia archaeon]
MKLEDKTAIVTGGGSGIGKGIALRFAKEGADVVIADLDIAGAETVRDEVKEIGQEALAVKTDVSDASSVDKLVEKTMKEFDGIDILVNNAGVYVQKPIHDTQEEEWDRVLDVNLKGTFLLTKKVTEKMLDNDIEGKIINIASIAGATGYQNSSAYCSSKGGMISLTKELGQELAPKGINVNAIGPGVIETDMTRDLLKDEDVKSQLLSMTPRGRIGKPEDIASAAVYLASDDADFVVGETIFVDGGWLTI